MPERKYLFTGCMLVTILFILIGCRQQDGKKENPVPIPIIRVSVNYGKNDPEEVTKWKKIIQSYYETILSPKLNGQILIAKNGEILFEEYTGFERLHNDSAKRMNAHSSIHLASVSKTFTAGAVLLLQQEHKLNIEDLITKYLPEFPYPGITLKMLLSHRAGLPNYLHNLDNWGWGSSKMASNHDILNLMISTKAPLEFTPDTKFSYCNTNYAMLALVIEKVSNQSYPDFLHDHIFYPLQMQDTYVFQPKDSAYAIPSYEKNNSIFPYDNLDGVYGDKNIYSTVRDLYKWDQALYTNSLLTAESKALAFTGYSNEKPGIKNYGFGWRMFNFPNQKKIIFHNGWWHGNNNAFVRLIDDSATIICLGNKYSKTNYSVMQLSYLFGDYPFELEAEEKDSVKINEQLLINQLKLAADSIRKLKKPVIKKDSLLLPKDTMIRNREKKGKLHKDSILKPVGDTDVNQL
jgi:CubicO group peptidase (beta-lactamase class C family)